MPRQPDPQLETRILRAAQKLFLRGGEKGLSMRALAKAAHTSTPAVYRRYKSRKQILEAFNELSRTYSLCWSLVSLSKMPVGDFFSSP